MSIETVPVLFAARTSGVHPTKLEKKHGLRFKLIKNVLKEDNPPAVAIEPVDEHLHVQLIGGRKLFQGLINHTFPLNNFSGSRNFL